MGAVDMRAASRRAFSWAFAIACLWLLYTLCRHETVGSLVDPRDYGAIGDGSLDCTTAIQRAIDICASDRECHAIRLGCAERKCTFLSGSVWLQSHMTFEVPAGVTLLGSKDPSRYPLTYTRVEGTMQFGHAALINAGRCLRLKRGVDASNINPDDGDVCAAWEEVKNVTVIGDGVIDGQGSWWWKNCFLSKDELCPDGTHQRQRPPLLHFANVDRLRITRLTLLNSAFWFIHPLFCNDVRVEGVVARAPHNSRNTDGFDPDSCTNVYVNDCVFETGDDCIAIKSGRYGRGVGDQEKSASGENEGGREAWCYTSCLWEVGQLSRRRGRITRTHTRCVRIYLASDPIEHNCTIRVKQP